MWLALAAECQPLGRLVTTCRAFIPDDIPAALDLWTRTDGVGLGASDTYSQLDAFLSRNPNTSCVAVVDGRIVGTVLAGHDGRRGYVHHLAVDANQRRRGLGTSLVQCAMQALTGQGIEKVHVFVFRDNNQSGEAFWRALGWVEREELQMFSRAL